MFTNGPLPQPTMHLPVSIDASLARFVRRAYFKRLTDEWGESGKLLKKAQQRNLNFGRRIKTMSGSRRISSLISPSVVVTSLQRRTATSPILKSAQCVSNTMALLRATCGW